MNQIYLYCEECKNFLNTMRDVLMMKAGGAATAGKGKGTETMTDAAVMSEIQHIVLSVIKNSTGVAV